MFLREITVYVFKYGVGGHFWAAMLDLKVKLVSENVKNHSVTFLMPEITANDTLFDFFPFCIKRYHFLGFQYGFGGHFGQPS